MNLKLLEESLLDFQKESDAKNQRHSSAMAKGQEIPLKHSDPFRYGATKSQVIQKPNSTQGF